VDEHMNLGVAFYKTSMFDEAVRELRHVLEVSPHSLDAEFFLGLVALRRGELEGAEAKFREILTRTGGARPAVFNDLAFVLERQGKAVEALALLDEALAKSVRHPKLYLSKALMQLKLGDAEAALSTLDLYKQAAGGEASALYYWALALARALSADLETALKLAAEGVERYPSSAGLVNNAGVMRERKGDLVGARKLFERAFELDPSLPQASKNLGDLLYREGRYEEAAEAYERALRADPELGDDVYAKLGNVYYKSRVREKAIEMWLRALELNPDNEVVRTNLEFVRGAAGG
jgi:tetratricopeptide (TPR) repeat protein